MDKNFLNYYKFIHNIVKTIRIITYYKNHSIERILHLSILLAFPKNSLNLSFLLIYLEVYATGLGSSEIDILKKKINEDNKIEFVAYNDNAKKFMRVFKATLP